MEEKLERLHGVGPALAAKFNRLSIYTVAELLQHTPRRYDDYSVINEIATLKPGVVTIKARLSSVQGRYVRRGMHITEALAIDRSGSLKVVWFNQPYRAGAIKNDTEYYLSGEFGLHAGRMSITSPSMEQADQLPLHTARIVPVYKETKGLTSVMIRKAIKTALEQTTLPETLPEWVLQAEDLLPRSTAVEYIHFPPSSKTLEEARHRLGFEEVFQLTLAALLNKYEQLEESSLPIKFDEALAKQFVGALPFKLSDDQRRVLWRIFLDMQGKHPMNRLVEGDVGSGKTVVAAMAAAMAMNHGYQVAYMAPTEILARQHATTLYELLQSIGAHNSVGLLIGGLKPAEKAEAQKHITSGDMQLFIGTHALFASKVHPKNLGLVIVDEQHRFGVEQRKKLQSKAGTVPHVLTMTATPIPRSLALTLYGELDISTIHTMPAGRKRTITEIISPNSRAQLYKRVAEQIAAGRQVFVVCPLIIDNTETPAPSAEAMYKQLQQKEFKRCRVGLLHGKMSTAEKDAVMQDFVQHKLDILVATTVIEVGVNVPNASVMIIEGADRFGLAQMHQLRGRIGRGEHQSYCFVVPSDSKPPSARLRAFASTLDGFKLAELDLTLRGPGAIYGTLQHGALDLRIARLSDTKLIAAARTRAQEFIERGERLLQYPQLAEHVKQIRSVTYLN